MKIALAGEISRIGGGQIYMQELINSLSTVNEVTLISNGKNDPLDIRKLVKYMMPVSYNYSESDSYLSIFKSVINLKKELSKIVADNFDLIINNHPNIFIIKGQINILHGFSFLDFLVDEKGKVTNFPLYQIIKHSGIYKIYKGANFLANSKYTNDISKKLFCKIGIDANISGILYPTFSSSFEKTKSENGILMLQRINRKKKIEKIFDIAQEIKDKIVITGAVNKGDEVYLREIIKKKPDNVLVIPNPTENVKNELMLKSSVYIHTNRKEHFGISVVEAMSHGLVPIVPKSGGPWVDIIENGKYGYGYSDIEEIPNLIDLANKDADRKKEDIIHSTQRFSREKFKSRLYNYIETALDIKEKN